jgi:hypothetical protein
VLIAEGLANAAVGWTVDGSPGAAAKGKSNLLHTALAARKLAPDDGGLGRHYPSEFAVCEPPRELASSSRTRLRTVPERSRVHPFAFARLRMAVSERLCWRPIQARAISQTAFEAWGQGLDRLAHARVGVEPPAGISPGRSADLLLEQERGTGLWVQDRPWIRPKALVRLPVEREGRLRFVCPEHWRRVLARASMP